MLEITPAHQFVTTLWKNGKGQTTELAINQGGSLEKFDWRLSIATVAEDGPFSNFSGYERNLILIEGNGLVLTHDIIHTDRLTQLLDFATFDGGSSTQGEILNGTIKDLNVMTAKGVCSAQVNTYLKQHIWTVDSQALTFAYSLSSKIEVTDASGQIHTANQGDLVKLADENGASISGEQLIIVSISYD